MTGKVTDEMLMAFVDGETDEATGAMIERAVAADAGLAARAEKFRVSRGLMRDAFGAARHEPVPEALVEAALPPRQERTVVPLPSRQASRFALPLAACLALAFGAAGYWAGQAGTGAGDPLGRAALAEALTGTKSGESRTLSIGGRQAVFRTLAAYRIEGGICRTFDVSGADASLSGVGCNRGTGWSVDLTVARSDDGGSYAPASGAALTSIGAYLDALEASVPLSETEESELSGR